MLKASGSVDQLLSEFVRSAGGTIRQTKDSGIYDAWNQAMDFLQSTSLDEDTYVAFLGLDDELNRDFCNEVARIAIDGGKPDFIYGNSRCILNGRFKDQTSPSFPSLFAKDRYVFDVPHPGMMNKWGAIRNYRFDTRYKLAADFDFYIGIAQRRDVSFTHVQKIQAMIGTDGMSNNASAIEIYIREWGLIQSRRNVVLVVPTWRLKILQMVAAVPFLLKPLRRLSWIVRAKKI